MTSLDTRESNFFLAVMKKGIANTLLERVKGEKKLKLMLCNAQSRNLS